MARRENDSSAASTVSSPAWRPPSAKNASMRAVVAQHLVELPGQRRQIAAADPAMAERVERAGLVGRERAQEGRR